ncbi:MAG: hypothetical protein ACLRSH_06655 [Turicibacter sp.]|jgi:hypothetical protein
MCEHKNIVVAHYANEETNNRIGCRVRCIDCDEMLFETKDKGVKLAYDFIKENKNKFDTLIDLTCDELNGKFNIKDGLIV